MKKINITESDVAIVATRLKQIASDIPATVTEGPGWSNPPAVKIIDCVLSLNRNYDNFVWPRLEVFKNSHPDTQRVVELANLMDSYPTPHAFVKQELNYNHENRANILLSVVRYVCTIVEGAPTASEENVLKQWAIRRQASRLPNTEYQRFCACWLSVPPNALWRTNYEIRQTHYQICI